MKVYEATKDDISEVSEMYRDMTTLFYPYRAVSDISSFVSVCSSWIESPLHYVFITKKENDICGLVIGALDDNVGLTDTALNITGLYVKKQYRGSRSALLLYSTLVALSEKMRVNLCGTANAQSASLAPKFGGELMAFEFERVFHG